jgi:hypothetical protein
MNVEDVSLAGMIDASYYLQNEYERRRVEEEKTDQLKNDIK